MNRLERLHQGPSDWNICARGQMTRYRDLSELANVFREPCESRGGQGYRRGPRAKTFGGEPTAKGRMALQSVAVTKGSA